MGDCASGVPGVVDSACFECQSEWRCGSDSDFGCGQCRKQTLWHTDSRMDSMMFAPPLNRLFYCQPEVLLWSILWSTVDQTRRFGRSDFHKLPFPGHHATPPNTPPTLLPPYCPPGPGTPARPLAMNARVLVLPPWSPTHLATRSPFSGRADHGDGLGLVTETNPPGEHTQLDAKRAPVWPFLVRRCALRHAHTARLLETRPPHNTHLPQCLVRLPRHSHR